MQMPTVTGNAFVPNQFSYFQALVSACKTKDPNKAIDVRMYGRSIRDIEFMLENMKT